MGNGRGPMIPRRRLVTLLDSLGDRRVVCVLGDPASGKTVAVQAWAEAQPHPPCWARVAPGADSPRRLLTLLVRATEAHCPDLHDTIEPELEAAPLADTADDPVAAAAVLAGALCAGWAERTAREFILIVDDVHSVRDPAGVAFLASLVRLLPRSMRLLLLARSAPPIAVDRLDAAGDYGELTPAALRFDAHETQELFAASGLTVDDDRCAAITEACGGWAGGLRLAVELALTHGVDGLLGRLGSSAAPTLLASVALAPLDEANRRSIRALTVLGRVDRAVTSTRPDVTARLDALAERGLLVTRDASGWSLTALARYAIEIALPPDPAMSHDVLRECVDMALDAGCPEPAMRWAAQLGEPDAIRHVLARAGWSLLAAGSSSIATAAACLPVPAGDVETDAMLGCYFAQRGDLDRALRHLGGADADHPLPAAVAWRVATALWTHGEASAAQRALDRVASPGTADETVGRADEAHLAATRATLAWARGEGPLARAHADAALRRARTSGDDAALGSAWVAQALVAALEGDLARNQRCYATALVHATAGHDVLTQLRVHCNIGSRLTEIGRNREAVAELEEALRLGEATGQRSRIALARLNQGQARLGLGRLDEALADVDAALEIWTLTDSPMVAFAHQARGDVLARRGDATRAARAYHAGIAVAEAEHDAQSLVPSLAGLARCLARSDPDDARQLAERALNEPAALGSVPAALARGWIALLDTDGATAARFARVARDEAARREDPSSLAHALVLEVLAGPSGPLGAAPTGEVEDARLSEAQALLEEVGDEVALAELAVVAASLQGDRVAEVQARARLRALGVRDSVALLAGPMAVLHERRRSRIQIRTLGNFAIVVGADVVPASAWQSRKARDLVKIVAARRGRAITREALAELLWPDSDGNAAGNRLSVALSTVRAVFDPAKSSPPDHVVMADRDSVRLNLRTVALDVEDYLAAADAGIAAAASGSPDAVPLLEAAAAAYGGDFCEEDPYESWATQPREELRTHQQQVLRSLADELGRQGRVDDAVRWAMALLALDPYDERTHQRLIATLVRGGRHGAARRAYRVYVERMGEIDVEPVAFPQSTRRPSSAA